MSSRVAKAFGLLLVASVAVSTARLQWGDGENASDKIVRVGDAWPMELQPQRDTASEREELFLVIRTSQSRVTCGIPTYPLRHYLHSNKAVPFTLVLIGGNRSQGQIFLRRERLRAKSASIRVIGEYAFRSMEVGLGVFMEAAGKVVGVWQVGGQPRGRLTEIDNYRS